jgi:hypothetical protein
MKRKKPITQLNVRFPPEVLDALRLLAEKHQRSLNGEIVWILRAHLEQEAKATGEQHA